MVKLDPFPVDGSTVSERTGPVAGKYILILR